MKDVVFGNPQPSWISEFLKQALCGGGSGFPFTRGNRTQRWTQPASTCLSVWFLFVNILLFALKGIYHYWTYF